MNKEVADIIVHLIWPSFISIWLFGFKTEIRTILVVIAESIAKAKNLELKIAETTLSAKDIGRELDKAAALAKAEVKELPHEKTKTRANVDLNRLFKTLGLATSPTNFDLEWYKDIAKKDLGAAAGGIRRDLEVLLENMGNLRGIERNRPESFRVFLSKLEEKSVLDPDQTLLVFKLYAICNSVVHGQELNANQTDQLFEIAGFLLSQLTSWLAQFYPKEFEKALHQDKSDER